MCVKSEVILFDSLCYIIREHRRIIFFIRSHSNNAVSIFFQVKNINDERVQVTLMNTFDATEATPVSPYDSDFVPFQIIANSIHDVFNNAILTPGVMVRIDLSIG